LKGPLLIFALLEAIISCASASTGRAFIPEPGPHAVGLRVVLQYDYSRTYQHKVDYAGVPITGERSRPLETVIWYPSQKGGDHLTYGDYIKLLTTEEVFLPSPADAEIRAKQIEESQYLDADQKSPMLAVRDSKPEPGLYPLVIYAPSYSAPAFENADLCEFLASHGYIVIASPSMGAHSRDMTGDLSGVHAQARDISFLIGFSRSIPEVDQSRIAVAGFSWGGLSNLFAAANDDRISALISLDGSARYFTELIEKSRSVSPRLMTTSVLFFTQADSAPEVENAVQLDIPGSPLNEMIHCDIYLVPMFELRHLEFSAMHQRSPAYWKHQPPAKYSPQQTAESYQWMVRYMLEFLDATFKHDLSSSAFLANSPRTNGVPEHLLAVNFRQHSGIVPTVDGLRTAASQRGFAQLRAVYIEARAQNPDMNISGPEFETWAKGLISEKHISEAIEVLKLDVSLNPNSAEALTELGEAYEKSRLKDLAIASYRSALQKDPTSEIAKGRLATIE
jgi:dienelactone hydrolase